MQLKTVYTLLKCECKKSLRRISCLFPAQTETLFWRGELLGAKNVSVRCMAYSFPEQTICYQCRSKSYTMWTIQGVLQMILLTFICTTWVPRLWEQIHAARVSQNRRTVEVGNLNWGWTSGRWCSQTPLLKAESPRAACSGPRPVRFQIPPWMEIPQPLRAICARVWPLPE